MKEYCSGCFGYMERNLLRKRKVKINVKESKIVLLCIECRKKFEKE